MSGKISYFISDIHLGAPYIRDTKAHERKIADWLDSILPYAENLFILGDALDYWYEYRYVVPRGYLRFFGALARLSDAGVKISWIKGNHDIWIFDYLPDELGIEVYDRNILTTISGKKFYIAHGDLDGEPRASYRRMQKLFRSSIAQRIFSAIHPRWTVPFAHKWSGHSRLHGAKSNDGLKEDDPLIRFSVSFNEANPPVDYFIFGHRHILAAKTIPPHSKLFVIGDAFDMFTYGEFNGVEFKIKKMDSHDKGTINVY